MTKRGFYIKCVLFVLVLSISGEISAQEKRDSVRIDFHQEKVNPVRDTAYIHTRDRLCIRDTVIAPVKKRPFYMAVKIQVDLFYETYAESVINGAIQVNVYVVG